MAAAADAPATTGAIIPFPERTYNFLGASSLTTALEVHGVREWVEAITSEYHSVDIQEATRILNQVGGLLQVAFAGSHGATCRPKIVKICADYDDVLTDASSTSRKFVPQILTALRTHQTALRYIDTEDCDSAMRELVRCADVAHAMAEASKTLVTKTTELSETATTALVEATEDQTISVKERNAIEKEIADAKTESAELEKSANEEAEAAKREAEAENTWQQRGGSYEKKLLAVGMIRGATKIAGSVVEVLNPQAAWAKTVKEVIRAFSEASSGNEAKRAQAEEGLLRLRKELAAKRVEAKHETDASRQRELEIEIAELEEEKKSIEAIFQRERGIFSAAEERYTEGATRAFQASDAALERRLTHEARRRKADVKLARTLAKIANTKVEQNKLQQAVRALSITIAALSRIKHIFNSTRLFWEGVEDHCRHLPVEHLEIEPSVLEGAVRESGLRWITLGTICHRAAVLIEEARRSNLSMVLPDDFDLKGVLKRRALLLKGELEASYDQKLEIEELDSSDEEDTRGGAGGGAGQA